MTRTKRLGAIAIAGLVTLGGVRSASADDFEPGTFQPTVLTDVTPSDNLGKNTSVLVSGVGYKPSELVHIAICNNVLDDVQSCGFDDLGSVTADSSGSWGPVAVVVPRKFTTPESTTINCSREATGCSIWIYGEQGSLGDHHLTFRRR